jgi:hypothetical protein
MSADLDFEPIPGLPEELPNGETIVWQGRPSWRALARSTFKARWLAAYLAFFVAARAVLALRGGQGAAGLIGVGLAAALATGCVSVVMLLAWMYARSSVYTITTKRVVMRIGVAIPMTWNLPFKQIAAADLTVRKDDDGDIVLKMVPPNRVAWLHLWPHVGPWNFTKARPALRAIAEPARVASLLAEAVKAWALQEDIQLEAIATIGAGNASSRATKASATKSVRAPELAAEAGQ